MANGDYGNFGKGDTGYAQYMTAFNRNFGGSSALARTVTAIWAKSPERRDRRQPCDGDRRYRHWLGRKPYLGKQEHHVSRILY